MTYKINFINASYRRFYAKHKREILAAINRVLSRGELILREDVGKFERSIAQYVGAKYAVGVASGTDALYLSLKALGVGPGDEVITIGNAFIAPIQAIVHTGATPILVDVGDDGLMDPLLLSGAITKKTKAVIPVHLSGKVCDMTYISNVALYHHLHVVEDACQALGGKDKRGRRAGSTGITGCFSFNTPKLLGAYGDGGMVVTSDKAVFEKLLLLRNHWNIYQGSVRKEDFPQPETMGWGFKSRLDNLQAAVLNVKFRYYPASLLRRSAIAKAYNQGLKGLPLALPIQYKGQVYQEYILRFQDEESRVAFQKHMQKKGIELLVRDTTPNHKLQGYEKELGHFSLPVTEFAAKTTARLPIYPELTDAEVKTIIKAANDFKL